MLKSEWKMLKYQIIVIITLYCQFIIIPKSPKVFCLLFLSKVTLCVNKNEKYNFKWRCLDESTFSLIG